MAFLEDPRLRQRWNQIAHDAEAVTENAAAGIWSFSHNYINPCLGSVASSIEQCTSVCLGNPEERRRRRRERERGEAAESNFDFYDDWYEEEEQGGILGGWSTEDWDRLLAGTGSQRRPHGRQETVEQPRRKRGMSYGTRSGRRKPSGAQDPTIIPSSQPIGFLSKFPWKLGGTLRYKPSAADLQEHPGRPGGAESEPLLGSDSSSDYGEIVVPRKRSGTTGSGDTSDSYRSRGDLFPSDGEGEEDAIPLDDEITYDMVRKDDRKARRKSKGKRPALDGSRTVSRSTLGTLASSASRDSLRLVRASTGSLPHTAEVDHVPSLKDLEIEEDELREEEEEKIIKQKEAATELALARGLHRSSREEQTEEEMKPEVTPDEVDEIEMPPSPRSAESAGLSEQRSTIEDGTSGPDLRPETASPVESTEDPKHPPTKEFVPARLPFF
ncbi:unnamed protein product [Clonostachys byssicola]|uniref:Uncharacterized protein n=1 Tax=Clonostachys byssicola TaxID=160290 RepID=A0A9N9U2A7_9HYPO|nr:unnamed protein product [Clonostachys byssicola]